MLWVTADDPILFQARILVNGMAPCSSAHSQREWLWRFKKEKQAVPQTRLPESSRASHLSKNDVLGGTEKDYGVVQARHFSTLLDTMESYTT